MTARPIARTPVAFLLTYVRARRWAFAGLAALVVGAGVCAVAVQYGMKLIVDAMAASDRAAVDFMTPFCLFLGLIALESALWRLSGWLGCRTIVACGVDMRLDLFEHLSGHSQRYFRQHLSGSLGSRISATSQSAGTIFGTLTWSIVPPCVDFVGAIVVLLTVDWRMAAALTAFVAVVAAVIAGFGARGRVLHEAYGEQASRVGGEIVDTVSNIWTVQAFSGRHREWKRLASELAVEAQAQRRSWMYLEKARVIHDVCLWVMAGSMLAWALQAWKIGSLTPGDVVLVSALSFRILHGSRDLALALVGTAQQFGIIAEMLHVVAQPHAMKDRSDARAGRVHAGAIELRRVSYSYPDGHKVFTQLDLKVTAGQKVGLVGASGAGKSTLLGLLQRVDDIDHGAILIDGKPIASLSHDSLRAAVAVVPQDISLFRRSVMENIRYGQPDASDDEVYAASRLAHCDEFIQQLSDGYDTIVGERGATLSGGQRQRLAIARAFLKNAPILLLDEATSSLDSGSELVVQAALLRLMRDRTVVAAAHRLATLQRFDRIIVLDDGKIVEDGPLDVLRGAGGTFDMFWRMQVQDRPAPAG